MKLDSKILSFALAVLVALGLGACSSPSAPAVEESSAPTLQPIVVPVEAPGLDASGTRIPVSIEGTTAAGDSYAERPFIEHDGTGASVPEGSYDISVLGSPISSDGTIYTIPDQSIHAEVNAEASDSGQATQVEGALKLNPVPAEELTDEQIAAALAFAKQDAKRADVAEDLAAKASKARDEALAAQAPKLTQADLEALEIDRQQGARLTFDTEHIYYVTSDGIVACDREGQSPHTLIAEKGVMTVFSDGERLYYGVFAGMDSMGYTIHSANLDGTDDKVIYEGIYTEFVPAVFDDTLYVFDLDLDDGNYSLLAVPLDGGEPTTVVNIERPRTTGGFRALISRSGLYYVDFNEAQQSMAIWQQGLDGSEKNSLVLLGMGGVTDFTATADGTLYWSGANDGDEDFVYAMRPDGTFADYSNGESHPANRLIDLGPTRSFLPTESGCYVWPYSSGNGLTLYRYPEDGPGELVYSDSTSYAPVLYLAGDQPVVYTYDGVVTLLEESGSGLVAMGGAAADAAGQAVEQNEPAAEGVEGEHPAMRFDTRYFSVELGENQQVDGSDTQDGSKLASWRLFYVSSTGKLAYETFIEVGDGPDYKPSLPDAWLAGITSEGYGIWIAGSSPDPGIISSLQPQ